MKEITLNIIKKNRVYFKCLTENGYEVKLKIDDLSENLTTGENILLVNDISVRTKYGTDVIYQLVHEAKNEDQNGIVTMSHHVYNSRLVEKCKELAGKYDEASNTWVFRKIVEEKVEELDEFYNTEIVNVELIANREIFHCQKYLTFMGYTLAKAYGRDSGAKLADNVIMTEGKIHSGGSWKNWGTQCDEGSKFIITVSKNIIKKYQDENKDEPSWSIRIID